MNTFVSGKWELQEEMKEVSGSEGGSKRPAQWRRDNQMHSRTQSSKQQLPERKELWQQTTEDLSKAWRILRLYSPPMCSALSLLLVDVTEITARLILHSAQVVHGPCEGDLNGFADCWGAALHHFDLVEGFVDSERNHFGFRKPLPK